MISLLADSSQASEARQTKAPPGRGGPASKKKNSVTHRTILATSTGNNKRRIDGTYGKRQTYENSPTNKLVVTFSRADLQVCLFPLFFFVDGIFL